MDHAMLTKIAAWSQLRHDLGVLKAKEGILRTEIFGGCFTAPKEGTNTLELPDAWKLKGNHKINRSVDQAAILVVSKQLPRGVADRVFKWEADLVIGEYRKQPIEVVQVIDTCLTIKPGMPDLELVAPKVKP